MPFQQTTFRTSDGVKLRGRLYLAAQTGPGLVMCPGFTCVLSMMNLPECAASLHREGFTVLLYDPRSVGSSDGQPRNDIDPPQAMKDMSDALTHLRSLRLVDRNKAGIFGISFGGTIALSTAAVDPRVRFTVAVAPLTDLDFTSTSQRWRLLQKCMRDCESQVMGNDPLVVPLINDKGENVAGFGHGIDQARYAQFVQNGRELAPGHINKVTLMTYYRISMWTPWPLWKFLGLEDFKGAMQEDQGRRVLFIIPTDDTVSYPEVQRKYYEEISYMNRHRIKKLEIQGAGHEDILGENYLGAIVQGIVQLTTSL